MHRGPGVANWSGLPLDERVRDRCRNALARGCGEEQRAPGHRLCRPRIGESGNRVDHNIALMEDWAAPEPTSSSIVA